MFLEVPMWTEEERDEHGAGRALMSALERDLGQMGFTIREGVESWEDYGWSLVVDHLGANIWCMVQASDEWLIQSWPESGLLDRLKRLDFSGPHRDVMNAILAALARQRTLSGATWLSEADIKAQ
jgi:hypothetical protein